MLLFVVNIFIEIEIVYLYYPADETVCSISKIRLFLCERSFESIPTRSSSFVGRTQLTHKPEQIGLIWAACQQTSKDHLSMWTIWSSTFIYCCLCATLFDCQPLFFICSLTVLSSALFGVKYLGNMLMSPNVNKAFYLLTAPSLMLYSFVVVMKLSTM